METRVRTTSSPTLTSEEQNIRLTIPAKAEYIGLCRLALSGLLRVRPIPDETLADLKLALTEACSNAVRHAYGDGRSGHVEVVFRLGADRLVIDVLDDGEGFVLDEPRANGEFDESGLWLAIIRAVTDGVEVHERETGRGARLSFSKSLA